MRAPLVVLALLLPLAPAGASAAQPWLAFTFEGPHVGDGLCDGGECHVIVRAFELPVDATGAYLELLRDRRNGPHVESLFDLYLASPSGERRALFHHGLSPAGVRGCFLPDVSCEYAGGSRTGTLRAEPGEWRVEARGTRTGGALDLAVFTLR